MDCGEIKFLDYGKMCEYSHLLENQFENHKFKSITQEMQKIAAKQIKSDLKVKNILENDLFWIDTFNPQRIIKIKKPTKFFRSYHFDIKNMAQEVEEVQITTGQRQ